MQVAIVAESFLPVMNGVTGSVLRMLDHFETNDIACTVIAAGAGGPSKVGRTPIVGLPSIGCPGYPQVRVALIRQRRMTEILRAIDPDVVHLASPMLLGHVGIRAAQALGVPVVAAFQTDVAGFAAHYGVKAATERIWSRLVDIHRRADLTLAPSTYAEQLLSSHGIERIRQWGRGVDHQVFAPVRRSRPPVGAHDAIQVGYAGRLAPEKQLSALAALNGIPGVQLVIIGDGPERGPLQQLLPEAHFTGHLEGNSLAATIANLDIFVHPGENETFCQGVQEALACGVPAVVPAAGGVRERITHGVNGWCYRPGDSGELRRAVEDLVRHPERRRAFSQAALASVAGTQWSDLGDQLVEHYRDVIRGQRQRTRLAA